MRIEGLIEMPPESKVTPLPTNAIVFVFSSHFRRRVLQNDDPAFALGALADAQEETHLFLFASFSVRIVHLRPYSLRERLASLAKYSGVP